MERARAALILTHNRQDLLLQVIERIQPQVDWILVIDNASEPPAKVPETATTIFVDEQPPNLSRLWNLGFGYFDGLYGSRPWDLAVLCDDALVPAGWFDAVTAGMRATGAVAGCSNPWGTNHGPQLKTAPDRDIMGRMIGWAFILDGTAGIRADESMTFWYLDTSIDFEARTKGGFVMVGGFPVQNVHPGGWTATGKYNKQIEEDREAFIRRWGYLPW